MTDEQTYKKRGMLDSSIKGGQSKEPLSGSMSLLFGTSRTVPACF